MEDKEASEVIRKLLHESGYKADIVADDIVASAASSLHFLIIVYSGSIQFRTSVGMSDGEEFSFKILNDRNMDRRFSKVYVKEESLILENDWWIDLSREDCAQEFAHGMNMWEVTIGSFREWMRDITKSSSQIEAGS